MSQLNVNVLAPLGYTGSNLTGNNNFVQLVDVNGDASMTTIPQIGHISIGGGNPVLTTTGCIAIGNLAGYSITENGNGSAIIIGNGAMENASKTGGNIAIGDAALQNTTGVSGFGNIAIGLTAGATITTGQKNTIIGYGSGTNPIPLTTGSNNTIIGSLAYTAGVNANNSLTLGNTAITTLRCAVTSITSLSDARDKENVKESPYGLDFVKLLKPVTFDWNTRDGSKVGVKDLGFIAQDLKVVNDENLNLVYEENPDKLEASYGRLIPVLVKAIQELSHEIEILKNK
jgi:hypothetical protein